MLETKGVSVCTGLRGRGKKLKISEMETSHIFNCIKLMKRQMVKAINKAMNKNDECYAEPPDSWVQTYQSLVDEYNKRDKRI